MSLSDDEKLVIAKRAAGSYAILPRLQSILFEQRKNKDPNDSVYLDFAKLASKGPVSTKNLEEYRRLQKEILQLHPDPYGAGLGLDRPKKSKNRRKCSICKKTDHTARKCPDKSKKAIVSDDGLPRLTPGWDPSVEAEDPTAFEIEEPSDQDSPGW